MTTYKLLRGLIVSKKYKDEEEIMSKLDVFLMGNRITIDEYNELVKMVKEV